MFLTASPTCPRARVSCPVFRFQSLSFRRKSAARRMSLFGPPGARTCRFVLSLSIGPIWEPICSGHIPSSPSSRRSMKDSGVVLRLRPAILRWTGGPASTRGLTISCSRKATASAPALALAAIVFRLELASPKSTLDKDLSALFQVLIAGFRELSERHNVGPLDVFLLLSLLAGEDSSVAIEKPTASCPVGRYRLSGSLPRFPITIARSSSRLLVRVHQ